MVSNGRLKDLMLITHDEYISLKQQKKNPEPREKQKQEILSKVEELLPPRLETLSTVEDSKPLDTLKSNNQGSEFLEGPTAVLPDQALVAQLNLNSRFSSKKTADIGNEDTNSFRKNPSNEVLSNLLQSGISGGKVERSRQIIDKIQECNRTTIDETTHSIILDQQDTKIGIVDFLTSLQVNTKQLPKQFLTLVEVLKLPQHLLANTYARQTSSQIHFSRSAKGESPFKRIKLDTEGVSNQWLTL